MICPRPQKCLLRHIYLPRNKLKRRSKYSITVRFRFISYARYPLLSVCLCVRVCLDLFVLVVWIYIYIYLYIYVAVQGLLRKARNIKRDMSRKRGYQPKKKLYLYVVAVIMTKFRGYQFNTPHQPTQLYGFPPSPLLLKYASYITFQITMFIVYTK